MTKEEFLSLKIGVKIINKQGKQLRISYKRNKDKWDAHCDRFSAWIHKDNYLEYEIAK